MSTPWNQYDPFHARAQGQSGIPTGYTQQSQPAAAYSTYAPAQSTYQGPPPQSGGYNYQQAQQAQPPAYSTQGQQRPAQSPQSGPTAGWYQAPTPQPQSQPQASQGQRQVQPSPYPNTGVVPPWWSQGQANYPIPQPPQAPAYQPPAQLDTDGYAAPQWMPQSMGGVMAGWDAGKWGDAGHLTPKYVLGHIASQYAPRTQNVPLVVADLQRAYGPGVRQVGDDKVYIPGVGTTDILQAAGSGGRAWQFLGQNQGTQAPQGAAPESGGFDPGSILQYLGFGAPATMPQQAQTPAAAWPDQTALLQSILQLLQQQQQQPQRQMGPTFTYY